MKYTKQFNPVRKVWFVYKCYTYGAELVKTFKTEKAADQFIRKNS